MHRGEEPRHAEAREPGPDRLAAHAEVPGADHGVGAADQIIHRQQANAALAHGHAAVGGIVAVVAKHEELAGRHRHLERVVEPSVVAHLQDGVGNDVRQRLNVTIGALDIAVVVLGLAHALWLQRGRMVIDEELALAHLDAVSGQSDNALDPGLRVVARPAEHHHVAALGRALEHPARLRQVDLHRQRGSSIAIGEFRGQQRVADQERRFHRAGGHIEWFRDGALGDEHREHDARKLHDLPQPATGLAANRDILAAHRPVPPTVIRSMRSVGWPTPTGTPWPFLPQVPIPLSSARSLPIMVIRWRSVGPLPISIVPFSGVPILPFSILYASVHWNTYLPEVMSTWPPPKLAA